MKSMNSLSTVSLQILSAAVHYGEPNDVVTLAVTATQCMREVSVGKEVREFKLPSKDEKNLTDKVNWLCVYVSAVFIICELYYSQSHVNTYKRQYIDSVE